MIRWLRTLTEEWDSYDYVCAGIVALLSFFLLLVMAGAIEASWRDNRCVLSHEEMLHMPIGNAFVPLRYHVCDQWGDE